MLINIIGKIREDSSVPTLLYSLKLMSLRERLLPSQKTLRKKGVFTPFSVFPIPSELSYNT